ncbi:MAG: DUF370 domain-containing protein [Bdellovibrionales bacterium]|nr:DUF370 domain-containing protein [Bdellovibrionales bacterium]
MSTKSKMPMLDVGFGNVVPKDKIVAIVAFDSDPVRKHCTELEKMHRVIDASKGRKVKSVVYLDSSFLVLSAVARETLNERLEGQGTES